MPKIDTAYNEIVQQVLLNGRSYIDDSRSVERNQIPSAILRHEFKDGFPILSGKYVNFNSVLTELIWFLDGNNDIKFLNENSTFIWNQDAYNWYLNTTYDSPPMEYNEFFKQGVGSVGRNYSKQWRDYNGEVDQIINLVRDMKENIMSTRLIVNAWNPSEIDKTALPPCHTGFQIVGVPLVDGGYGFELHWHQRSVDLFLGLPFNIASYATLAYILEKITGHRALAIQGDLKCVHIYSNADENIRAQIKRKYIFDKPDLIINPKLDIDDIDLSDFYLYNYKHHGRLRSKMLAPNENVKINKNLLK